MHEFLSALLSLPLLILMAAAIGMPFAAILLAVAFTMQDYYA